MLDCTINILFYILYLQTKKIFPARLKALYMISASDNRYSALGSYFTSLNGIAKLSPNNSFESHISKVAPLSQNQVPPKIKSGPGQSGPTTINSLGVLLCFSPSLKPICRLTFPIME